VEWIAREILPKLNTVTDFMDMLKVFDREDLTEFQYVIQNDEWNVILK
jgi:8-oxo-dGTP diphosphatase